MVTAAIHIANFWRMMSNVLKNIASSPANVRFAWIGFQPFGAESRASFRPAVTSNIRSLGGGLEILFVTRRRGGSLLRGAT